MNTPYVDELRSGKMPDDQIDQELFVDHVLLYKKIQNEKIFLSKNGLQYEEIENHPDRALYAYPIMHYNYWDEHFTINPIDIGALGENLVISGVNEFTTFIGDTYQFGEAVIQVSQPLFPKLLSQHPFSSKEFITQMKHTGKTGWFYRVIEEGYVKGDIELELLDRPYPEWSIAAINEAMYKNKDNLRLAYELSQCELLSPSWKNAFIRRLHGYS